MTTANEVMKSYIVNLEDENGEMLSWYGEAFDPGHAADLASDEHADANVIGVEEEH